MYYSRTSHIHYEWNQVMISTQNNLDYLKSKKWVLCAEKSLLYVMHVIKKSFSVDNSMLFYLNFIITSYFFFVHNMFVLLYSVIYILCCRTNRVANIFISHISKLDCSSKRTKIFGHQSISSYLVPHWWPRNSICAITICFTLWWSFYHWSTFHLH